jgi:cellulose synthase/poly-beta-1,6-N-acetylglucosamine synthase-like glycosyltransferase
MSQTARIARFELPASRVPGRRLHWHPPHPSWSPRQSLAALSREEAEDAGLWTVDPLADPPDLSLVRRFGAANCLRAGLLPWRRLGSATVVLSARPGQLGRHADRLSASFGEVRMAHARESDLRQALLTTAAQALVTQAETSIDAAESSRSLGLRGIAVAAFALVALLVFFPTSTLVGLTLWAIVCFLGGLGLKIAALLLVTRATPPVVRIQAPARLPVVSILVPLYRESEIADHLLRRMAALDYPRELLDLCIILEDDDETTRAALHASSLPHWAQVIEVPRGTLRTKPRALNYALSFARGSIIGIYDAEDVPAPDHLKRVVSHFASADADVGCLQGVLDYFNPRANWLARCFTLEYAGWFRVILPGLARLGLVVPLGGTTLFMRRHAIEVVGGWDAHNVTEDADLGVRLARHGFRTELIGIVTQEEANAQLWPWIRQRSRWLKGYAITWLVHMRNPLSLWRDLGSWRFLGIQLVFLATLSQLVLTPLIWSFCLLALGLPHPLQGTLPDWQITAICALFVLSLIVEMLLLTVSAIRSGKADLALWAPTYVFYHPLATIAAYRGLWQIVNRPYFWDKTTHGHFRPVVPLSDADVLRP